MLFCYSTASI